MEQSETTLTWAVPATLADVARKAGVSLATASKAMNGKIHVAQATRAKVLMAAQELEYTANPLARGLPRGRSGTVGLITRDAAGRFSLPLLKGVEDEFGLDEIAVFLCEARLDPAREVHYVKALLERRVDGLIIVDARTDTRPPLVGDIPIPVIYAYGPSSDPRDCSVAPDGAQSGRLAAQHLVAAGRRNIVIAAGDRTYSAANERVSGALMRLEEEGIVLPDSAIRFGTWSENWGRTVGAEFLREFPALDGVICGNDQIARGILDALHDAGRAVPSDVAVIGHDNWEDLCINARPPLTSLDMNLEAIGRMTALRLREILDGKEVSGIETVEPRLVVRGSSVA